MKVFILKTCLGKISQTMSVMNYEPEEKGLSKLLRMHKIKNLIVTLQR